MLNFLISVLYFAGLSDTLELPLKNGLLTHKNEQSSFWHSHEATIMPTSTFIVQSISNGVVENIVTEKNRSVLNIKSGVLIYSYELDTAILKKGDPVDLGQIIGHLKLQDKESAGLVFVVTRHGKLLDARRFLKYK